MAAEQQALAASSLRFVVKALDLESKSHSLRSYPVTTLSKQCQQIIPSADVTPLGNVRIFVYHRKTVGNECTKAAGRICYVLQNRS